MTRVWASVMRTPTVYRCCLESDSTGVDRRKQIALCVAVKFLELELEGVRLSEPG